MSHPAVNTPAIPPSLMFRERPRISRRSTPRMLALNSVSISYLGYRRLVVGGSDCRLPSMDQGYFSTVWSCS